MKTGAREARGEVISMGGEENRQQELRDEETDTRVRGEGLTDYG